MKLKFVVVGEHTLGYTYPETRNTVWILSASILRGAVATWMDGSIAYDSKTTRPAKLADFETYRISPDTVEYYKTDPNVDFPKD